MERITGHNPAVTGLRLEQAVSRAFSSVGWTVEEQPVLGGAMPDFLMSGPDGQHLVVEVKATTAPIHFGMVAQVAEYAALAESINHLPAVGTALLTTAPVSAAAQDAADQLGVSILGPDDDQDLDDLAMRWAQSLTRSSSVKSQELAHSDHQVKNVDEGSGVFIQGSAGMPSRWTDSTPAYSRARSHGLRVAIGIGVVLLLIALGVVAIARSEFSHHSPRSPRVEQPHREAPQSENDASTSSSPLVPILIAIAVLAAVSIGAFVLGQRRERRHDPVGARRASG